MGRRPGYARSRRAPRLRVPLFAATSWRHCTRLLAATIVLSFCVTSCGAAARSKPTDASVPPPGFTPYGDNVWELDALLHDTFGMRGVNLLSGGFTSPSNFTTEPVATASGGPYTYTFAKASHSTFKLVRPAHPPRAVVRAGGSPYEPLTVRGAYISCGRSGWVYQHEGDGSPNEFFACLKTSGGGSRRTAATTAAVPPAGLTAYGVETLELDALLHETFGGHVVYLRWGNPARDTLSAFTTHYVPGSSGGRFSYVFAGASHSTFKLVRPATAPQLGPSPTEPLTVRGEYISCGHGRLLYEDENPGNVDQFAYCAHSVA